MELGEFTDVVGNRGGGTQKRFDRHLFDSDAKYHPLKTMNPIGGPTVSLSTISVNSPCKARVFDLMSSILPNARSQKRSLVPQRQTRLLFNLNSKDNLCILPFESRANLIFLI